MTVYFLPGPYNHHLTLRINMLKCLIKLNLFTVITVIVTELVVINFSINLSVL